MSRVAVTTQDGAYAGHFDWDKADRWSDRDYNGNGSGGAGAGEAVMLTAGGKWALEHWTNWQGQRNRYEWITPDDAHAWLLRNGEDAAVEKHFGAQPEEVDLGGRPAIGGAVHIRLGDLLPAVDAYAAHRGVTRAAAARMLTEFGLATVDAHGTVIAEMSARTSLASGRGPVAVLADITFDARGRHRRILLLEDRWLATETGTARADGGWTAGSRAGRHLTDAEWQSRSLDDPQARMAMLRDMAEKEVEASWAGAASEADMPAIRARFRASIPGGGAREARKG